MSNNKGYGSQKQCMNCMGFYDDKYDVCPHCGYQEGEYVPVLLHMKPGTVLNGRYVIGNALGYGSFGVTYVAWDQQLNRRIAIKEYLPSEFGTRMPYEQEVLISSGEKARAQYTKGLHRFVEEGKKLAKVGDIEGIVHMYDSFEANNTAYITMEYLEGETLSAFMEREGRLSEKQTMELMLPVLQALEQVHEKGIIHRDISPDNIFLSLDDHGGLHVKLIDFGAAKFSTTSHSKSLTVLIKSGYSPEEQYRSDGEQGPYTDVYAAAAVMYHMVTGVKPPDALERRTFIETKKKDPLEEPSKYNKEISENFQNALLNALNVRIEDRTANATQFMNELVSFEPVKRRGSTIRRIDFMRWPLWAKIGVPIATVVAIGLMVFAGTRIFSTATESYALPAGMTRVPDFINSSYSQAEEWATKANLLLLRGDTEFVPNMAAEVVLAQDKSSGSVVRENEEVRLSLSSEAATYLLPDVTGMTLEDAAAALQCMDLQVLMQDVAQPGLADGCVVSQDIAAFTEVRSGEQIVLGVSTRAASQAGQVPDLVGLPFAEALARADSAHVLLQVKEKTFSKDHGNTEVLEQSLAPGSKVAQGQVVEVSISLDWREFPMPNLLYTGREKALQILRNIGIEPMVTEEENELVAANCVVAQSVAANTDGANSTVMPGESITLTVSKGGRPVPVPNVAGMDLEGARKAIGEAKLAADVEYEYAEGVEEGHVISQDPQANVSLNRGTAVKLIVCSYKDVVSVENVVGLDRAEAVAKLEGQGLKVKINEAENETVAAGKVSAQLPEAGSQQIKGTEIVVTVSKGPKPTPSPSPTPTPSPTPASRPSSADTRSESSESYQVPVYTPTQEPAPVVTKAPTPTPTPTPQPVLSEWSDYLPAGKSAVETRTVYRYRDNTRETTTEYSDYLSGWTQYDSEKEYGEWSGWRDDPVSESSTRQVETRTVEDEPGHYAYRYVRYVRSSNGKTYPCETYISSTLGDGYYYEDTGWIDTRFAAGAGSDHSDLSMPGWTCGKNGQYHSHGISPSYYGDDGGPIWTMYHDTSGYWDSKTWYTEQQSWVDATTKTQYRYREIRTKYYYERYVDGYWSDWSTTPAYADGEQRNVETKTQYRYYK